MRGDRERSCEAVQTKSERDAATEFVLQHRLSIANEFHRRLVRGDVELELTRLLEQAKEDAQLNPDRYPARGTLFRGYSLIKRIPPSAETHSPYGILQAGTRVFQGTVPFGYLRQRG